MPPLSKEKEKENKTKRYQNLKGSHVVLYIDQ